MFLLKKKTLQESLSVQVDLNWEIKEGLISPLACEKITMTVESEIHNIGFLISPTMHLFLLSGQLGSCGVSSMITLNSKYGIMKNVIKVYNPA